MQPRSGHRLSSLRMAASAFRYLDRDELVAEAVAFAYCAFIGLARQGRLQVAYATPLANYAIAEFVLDGKRLIA